MNRLLEPSFETIYQVLSKKYFIPVYQRPYSWQEEQVTTLINDIFESFREPFENESNIKGLYIGNIILHKKESCDAFDIIDGQQRITALSLFMLASYARLIELNIHIVDKNNDVLKRIKACLWKGDSFENSVKEERDIELGSIDKDMIKDIFNYAFDNPYKLKEFVSKYDTKDIATLNNLKDSFLKIYNFLETQFDRQKGELLKFLNFVLDNVYVIAIVTNESEAKTFSIFESINSKGKKLEDIDLIKTHIFSKLKTEEYSSYLDKWGQLIIRTNDNLYVYLEIYIKAYIKYFSQSISFSIFKKLDSELFIYFHSDKISECYKKLIDDMILKVDYFNALYDIDKFSNLIRGKKLRFYYLMFIKIGYKHPRPLFFRCLCEYGNNALFKEDLTDIFIEVIKFMITFLTLSNRDSKDAINLFSKIASTIYHSNLIDKDEVIFEINQKIKSSVIAEETIINLISSQDMFDNMKALGVSLLSVYESQTKDGDISWDEAYSKFISYGSSYSLDHIMNQSPDMNDKNLKYFDFGGSLKLKEGNDFPSELVSEGMKYDDFKNRVLNRIGNLRLMGCDINSKRGNESDVEFCTFKSLDERSKTIARFVTENVLNITKASLDYHPKEIKNKNSRNISGNFDFSMYDLDLTYSKVKTLTIMGNEPVQLERKNKNILIYIVKFLFEKYPQEFIKFARENKCFHGKRPLFSTSGVKLHNSCEIIKDKVYVETNFSTNDIISISRELLNLFNIPLNQVSIYISE